jgi:hypothetical protein
VLHGTSRRSCGLGGDDNLRADDTYYYFDGDSLYGGAGNDTLSEATAQTLYGGPGGNSALRCPPKHPAGRRSAATRSAAAAE